ncbi:copper-transporting ATPase PAA1, chloroplastic [Amaranthus tricolor]|uniref:copper-transporting ATPase PAA1, chloroplastic n=1 Tax=Amaranthus tricolor TaxID=29722 RepID=UPI00258895F7|nr:copper-transporting ATPase PAA1, chloroplastic [Amaranthus tricolor]XP_057518381.1 copper-transporting ATPase PAA1, chloroplastic [Amaranthus tricolor]
MESTLSPACYSLFTLSKSLRSSSSVYPTVFSLLHCRRLSTNPILTRSLTSRLLTRRLNSSSIRGFCSPIRCFSYGGGGGIGGGSGGGGDGSDGGVPKVTANAVDDVSALSPDAIVLDVTGMTCGGCASKVKKILENQPQVSSASVNLATETAIVWLVSEAKAVPNWRQELGEILAKHLTNCGFESNLRDLKRENVFQIFQRKMDQKRSKLRESGRELAVSWALCAVCMFGHLSHFFWAKASWIHVFHSTGFHLSLSLFTLLGPGRQLIVDGLKSFFRGAPNMNTLVGLGALSSFTVSSLAAFIPKLGWKAFFEEPIMLIAFVLLGRNLEQRAKIKATSDLTSLLSILPSKARLLVNAAEDTVSTVEVPCSDLSVGDKIVVFPGDRVPADGTVRAGRSTVDESSFSGEPLPVTKLPGTEVSAGSINLNGTLTIEVQRPGGETIMGDIVRLVEEAQSREAPVQRLADKVAGQFTYGVMALSAATFMFWTLFGSRILPSVLSGGSSVSLALQLSCSVLVVACPCALGLATPTAVLVGTSLGAKRGLLLRGGDVLEKFSAADVIVFDKTGTLTIGKPVVTKVVTLENEINLLSDANSVHFSEAEVLKLAASVESNTIHPVGKAIVQAARSIGCQTFKAADGTFMEEPGSGAVATIESKRVAVGTLEWLQRHGLEDNPFRELEDQSSNQSVVYIGIDGNIAGLIYIEDQIREDAKNVVQTLFNQGVDVYMLSGDKRQTAEHVASIVGIPKDKVFSGVKPHQKKKFISELQSNKKIVAMVGDGINDAAALASSHVGVAMGGGVGAASEVSSIVLLGNRLTQVLDALELSKLTMKTIKQNLWWAFGYNIVGLPIAAGMLLPVTGVMLTPSIAGALMGLSSIGVMTNSLLLRLKFSSKQTYGSEIAPIAEDQSAFQVLVDRNQKPKTYSDSSLKNAS